ncbi:glycosyltransferase family 8 protein [Candidatus Saccharibacteria bacterium]|nr:glycosyltransferase family 8 protein [Candidatus Saccharibacteria bacterium]
MNILYCGDKGIARGVLVSILSILKHNSGPIHFYIMTIKYKNTEAFSLESAQFLDGLVKKTNPKSFVKLIDATEVFVENLPKKNMKEIFFPPAAMLRLYIGKVPELNQLKRILYLDYDVVCRGDLSEFYNTDLEGVQVAGVLDIYGKNFYHYRGIFNFDYMNSGVMLFNIPECLEWGIFERAAGLCAKRWMMLADQAALNKVIDKRKLMPRKFNEQGERPRKDTVLHHFSNNFKFLPFFHVQKVKPFETTKIHKILKIHEYDDILEEYKKLSAFL